MSNTSAAIAPQNGSSATPRRGSTKADGLTSTSLDKPQPPSLSDGLRSVLASALVPVFSGEMFVGLQPNRSWEPPPLTPDGKLEIERAIAALEIILRPGDPSRLGARIGALLEHWMRPERDHAIDTLVKADWIMALRDYPLWAVQQACLDYLRLEERPPKPASIRRLCDAVVRSDRQTLEILRRLSGLAPRLPPALHAPK